MGHWHGPDLYRSYSKLPTLSEGSRPPPCSHTFFQLPPLSDSNSLPLRNFLLAPSKPHLLLRLLKFQHKLTKTPAWTHCQNTLTFTLEFCVL